MKIMKITSPTLTDRPFALGPRNEENSGSTDPWVVVVMMMIIMMIVMMHMMAIMMILPCNKDVDNDERQCQDCKDPTH